MNHKRKRPKNRRGGCLFCKYYKMNGFGRYRSDSERFSNHKRRIFAKMEIELNE